MGSKAFPKYEFLDRSLTLKNPRNLKSLRRQMIQAQPWPDLWAVSQIRLDTDARVRRALLSQSTPTRGPYPVGSYVYFYQLQAPVQARAQGRRYRWFGPARVIGVELKNQRRSEDPELPTEGGQPHAYWLRYGPSVILVTGEQLRFASEDELLAAHYLPEEILQVTYYVVETMLISEVMLPNFNFKAQKLMSQPVICSLAH